MPDDLYDEDFVAWTERQASLLRRHAAGERVNGLDWDNIIEEVETMGRSETKAVRSLLIQAILHALKLARWPKNDAAAHWREEALNFLDQARDDFLPSMGRSLDIQECFTKARERALRAPLDGPAQPIPETAPLSLAQMMDPSADLAQLVEALGRGH